MRALEGLDLDGVSGFLEGSFVLGQVAAQALEARQVGVAAHLTGTTQALHVRDGFFQHAALGFQAFAAGIREGDLGLRFLRQGDNDSSDDQHDCRDDQPDQ